MAKKGALGIGTELGSYVTRPTSVYWCHPSSSNDVSSNASLSKFLSNVLFRLKGNKCTGRCFVVMGGDLSDRSD